MNAAVGRQVDKTLSGLFELLRYVIDPVSKSLVDLKDGVSQKL
jgi:hypothetical protein